MTAPGGRDQTGQGPDSPLDRGPEGDRVEGRPLKGRPRLRHEGADGDVDLLASVFSSLREDVPDEDDELVEVTPKSIRLRKKFLTETDRKRASRAA